MRKFFFHNAGAVQHTPHNNNICRPIFIADVYHRQSTSSIIHLQALQIRVYGSARSYFDDPHERGIPRPSASPETNSALLERASNSWKLFSHLQCALVAIHRIHHRQMSACWNFCMFQPKVPHHHPLVFRKGKVCLPASKADKR